MSYLIVPSRRFRKALERCQKGGLRHILASFAEVADLLAAHDERSLFTLGTRWHDHALRGDKGGLRELHLSQDDLLLYAVDEGLRVIKLLDIVNHEELRKR